MKENYNNHAVTTPFGRAVKNILRRAKSPEEDDGHQMALIDALLRDPTFRWGIADAEKLEAVLANHPQSFIDAAPAFDAQDRCGGAARLVYHLLNRKADLNTRRDMIRGYQMGLSQARLYRNALKSGGRRLKRRPKP